MWWRVRSQVDRRRGATGPAVAAARRAFHLAARREPQLDPGPMLVELASSLRDAGDEECFEWFHRAIQDAHHAGRLPMAARSEEHTSELQSRGHLVCRLLLEKKKKKNKRDKEIKAIL